MFFIILASAFTLSACQGKNTSSANFTLPSANKVNWTGNKELDLAYYAYTTGKFAEAFKGFEQLHQHGNLNATLMLARCYEQGRGVNIDLNKAKALLQQSVQAKEPSAVIYANYSENKKSLPADISALSKIALAGHVPAQNLLGFVYEQQEDNCNAFKEFTKASQAGYPPAIYNISRYYAHGLCTQPNQIKAKELENSAYHMGYKLSQ